ncbi:MAG: hypothetical protein AAFP90_00685 [Planctomycetota bacterium]
MAVQPILGLLGTDTSIAGDPTQLVFSRCFRHLGMDWQFLTLPIQPNHLATALSGLRVLPFDGLLLQSDLVRQLASMKLGTRQQWLHPTGTDLDCDSPRWCDCLFRDDDLSATRGETSPAAFRTANLHARTFQDLLRSRDIDTQSADDKPDPCVLCLGFSDNAAALLDQCVAERIVVLPCPEPGAKWFATKSKSHPQHTFAPISMPVRWASSITDALWQTADYQQHHPGGEIRLLLDHSHTTLQPSDWKLMGELLAGLERQRNKVEWACSVGLLDWHTMEHANPPSSAAFLQDAEAKGVQPISRIHFIARYTRVAFEQLTGVAAPRELIEETIEEFYAI